MYTKLWKRRRRQIIFSLIIVILLLGIYFFIDYKGKMPDMSAMAYIISRFKEIIDKSDINDLAFTVLLVWMIANIMDSGPAVFNSNNAEYVGGNTLAVLVGSAFHPAWGIFFGFRLFFGLLFISVYFLIMLPVYPITTLHYYIKYLIENK